MCGVCNSVSEPKSAISSKKIDYVKEATDSADVIAAGLASGPAGATEEALRTLAREMENQYEAIVQNAGPVSIPNSSVVSVEAEVVPKIRKLVHGTLPCCNLATI